MTESVNTITVSVQARKLHMAHVLYTLILEANTLSILTQNLVIVQALKLLALRITKTVSMLQMTIPTTKDILVGNH